MAIVEAVAAHRRRGGTGSRGTILKGLRVLLLVTYSLLQNRLSDERLRELLEVSDNTIRYMRADLEAIGMPAGVDPDHRHLLYQVVAEFHRRHPHAPETLPDLVHGDVVDAPWANRLDNKYDDELEGFPCDDEPPRPAAERAHSRPTREAEHEPREVDDWRVPEDEDQDEYDDEGNDLRYAPPRPRRRQDW